MAQLTPQGFKERFIASMPSNLPPELLAELGEFVSFDPSHIASLDLAEADTAILTEVGLPRNSPPFFYFGGDRVDLLAPLDGAPGKIIIGANGFGDHLCIDLNANGAIIEVDNENRRQTAFMNSSIASLALCLCAFSEFRTTADGEAFQAEIAQIDPIAVADDSWWMGEIAARLGK